MSAEYCLSDIELKGYSFKNGIFVLTIYCATNGERTFLLDSEITIAEGLKLISDKLEGHFIGTFTRKRE